MPTNMADQVWRIGSIFSCCKGLWDCRVLKPITTKHQSVFWLVSQSRRMSAIFLGSCRWIHLLRLVLTLCVCPNSQLHASHYAFLRLLIFAMKNAVTVLWNNTQTTVGWKHNLKMSNVTCEQWLTAVSEWVSRFLTAHQHNYAIQCRSCWYTLENTGQKTNQKQTLQKLNTTQKKQTTQNTAKTSLVQSLLMTLCQETRWAYSTTFPNPHGAADSMVVISANRGNVFKPRHCEWRQLTACYPRLKIA